MQRLQDPKELGPIGASHLRMAQSTVKLHSKPLLSDAAEGWNTVITEEPHQPEQQKLLLFPLSQNTPRTGGSFPDSLCSYDLAGIKGYAYDTQATWKTMPGLGNDASSTGVIKSLKFHNSSACVMETKTSERTYPGGENYFFSVGQSGSGGG